MDNSTMRKINSVIFILLLFSSCRHNPIETGDSLSKADIAYIQGLQLLDKGEIIYKFYSEASKKEAGNLFTNKRIATYWMDKRNSQKSQISFAFYPDIQSIDTVYYAGLTYCPYMLVTKKDSTKFKVSVAGSHRQIKAFFEDALRQWKLRQ